MTIEAWSRRVSRASRLHFAAVATLLLAPFIAGEAAAAITGAWTLNGSTSATTTILGFNTSVAGNVATPYANQTLNTTNFWTDPYGSTVAGGASLYVEVPASLTASTFTFTFTEPVNNPVLHVDRLGGISGGVSNSSQWTLVGSTSQGGGVTLTRLGGNTPFVVAGSVFRRTINVVTPVTQPECENSATGTGCGSIQFNGTGITSLSFSVVMIGSAGLGDGVEFRWSLLGSNVIVRKQSSNGVGTFGFTRGGAIGAGTFSLNTATTNPAVSATFPVNNHGQAITLAETQDTASFTLATVACLDQAGATVTATVAGGTVQIAPASYGANQTITCTFNNTLNADVSTTKTNTPASGPVDQASDTVTSGTATAYTIVVSNAGPGGANGAVLRDPVPGGVACTAVSCGSATGGATCPAAGAVTVAALQSASGLVLPVLPANGSLTFTLQCTVP